MSSNNINDLNIDSLSKEEEVDLYFLKSFILRRKKIISIFAGFGLFYGGFIVLNSPKIWEGRFQIVLENQEQSVVDQNIFPGFLNNRVTNSNLMTEVEILKSPSVLFDIFDFVKTQKISKELKFDNWLENLDIELKNSTSVLNLSYRDDDKKLILPVLDKISIAYQSYAGSKKIKDLELSLNYLNKEIDIYKKKSFASFIKSTNYAKVNKLDILYANPNLIDIEEGQVPNLNSFSLFNIEQYRRRDVSSLENINAKLNLIEKYKDDSKMKINLITKIAKDLNQLKIEKLEKLENLITYNLSIYRENDPKIRQLFQQKEFLLKDLEENVISFLTSEKELLEAKMKISSRPQEVIDKYKQLLSQAYRDQRNLEKLENERSLISLSISRKDRPWQLITKPTLLDQPVSLSRKKVLLIELLKFSIIGIFAGYLLDKKDGLVYNQKKIEQLLDCKLIQELSIENQENWQEILGLYSEKFSNEQSLSIIPLGNIENLYIDKFSKSLLKFYKKDQISVTENYIESVKKKAQLIIVSPGLVKREQIIELNKFFSLTKSNLIGFFLLN